MTLKFDTKWTAFIVGFSYDLSGTDTETYAVYIGPWSVSFTRKLRP